MRPPRAEQKQTILALAKATTRPLLIGDVAVKLGWWATLKDTEALLEEMVCEGTLRPMTKEEGWAYGVRWGYRAV